MNTKPTIETILLLLQEFRAETNTRFDRLEQRLNDMQAELTRVNRKIAVLSDDTVGLRADMAELRDQQEKLTVAVNSLLPTKIL
ncbi:MAG TPA: hypothetical protein PLB32_16260 [Acidobacteriota bacterium]|nr:hypothetical protein [Acidobacteriota bacterium]